MLTQALAANMNIMRTYSYNCDSQRTILLFVERFVLCTVFISSLSVFFFFSLRSFVCSVAVCVSFFLGFVDFSHSPCLVSLSLDRQWSWMVAFAFFCWFCSNAMSDRARHALAQFSSFTSGFHFIYFAWKMDFKCNVHESTWAKDS